MSAQKKAVPALILKMNALLPTLSKSEQKVVQYIMENSDEVIYLALTELAENSGVSDPTVVRTYQKLGFNSYQDLKVTLAKDIVSPLRIIQQEVLPDDSIQVMIDKVFQSTIHTLTYTHNTINAADMESAAKTILEAKRFFIFGSGSTSPLAFNFQYKLMRLGINAITHCDPHLQAIAATYMDKGDVIFSISQSGSSKSIVDNSRLGKQNGATLIALTNLGRTPLSKLAHIHLYTASTEARYRVVVQPSRIAQDTLIDVLCTYIAVHRDWTYDFTRKEGTKPFLC